MTARRRTLIEEHFDRTLFLLSFTLDLSAPFGALKDLGIRLDCLDPCLERDANLLGDVVIAELGDDVRERRQIVSVANQSNCIAADVAMVPPAGEFVPLPPSPT